MLIKPLYMKDMKNQVEREKIADVRLAGVVGRRNDSAHSSCHSCQACVPKALSLLRVMLVGLTKGIAASLDKS